ncbi:MAG: Na+/H+ antiporter NhaC family protein [Phycisphaerae bacterium]|jgi:Na+/H+ antiporter NhaC|nr:Na+/H+ antiporter NhaC family protein [Phycisphaerae bacterium]
MSDERAELLKDFPQGGSTRSGGRWRLVVAGVFLLFIALSLWASFAGIIDLGGWHRVAPPLVAIVLALLTGRLYVSLVSGVLAGGLLSAAGAYEGFFSWLGRGGRRAGEFVANTVYDCQGVSWGEFRWNSFDWVNFGWGNFDSDNLKVLLFIALLMPIINVMIVGGGLQGVAGWLMRWAKSARSTRLVTMISGLVIFIDDYANTLIVGPTLRPLTDRQHISREKLAFLVDATAAPIAGIALVSTWIGYEVGLLSELGVGGGGYVVFLNALAFRFYCFGMIAFVFWNCWSGADFGPMAAAERRARAGKVLADDAVPMASKSMNAAHAHGQARIHAAVAIVPMAVLLLVFLGQFWVAETGRDLLAKDPGAIVSVSGWMEAMSSVSSSALLARAAGVALVAAIVLALGLGRIPIWAMARAIGVGLKSSLMPLSVLILAWSLKGACKDLETGAFLAGVLGDAIPPLLFPGIVFVVAAGVSFATGTSYGTMAILIPTAVPVAMELDGGYGLITMISIGAVLDGAIFGDHCSPISDTTIMSSVASSCDHVHHVRTQLPYCLVVAFLALSLGYLPAAMGVSPWIGVVAGAGVSGLLFACLRIFGKGDKSTT